MPIWLVKYWKPLAVAAMVALAYLGGWVTNGWRKDSEIARINLEAASNARRVDAEYRRIERETAADFSERLEKANEDVRLSNNERDRARADADSLRDTIARERRRAAQAAAGAGIPEAAVTRAWDVLKACTDEYQALAADADAAIDDIRPGDAWAKSAANVKKSPHPGTKEKGPHR